MNDQERQHARALAERLLAEAQQDITARSYAHALVAIRKAKVLDVTNVYILAFERQVEQLDELTSSGAITDDQRNDILESLPGIIEQALASQAPLATPETAEAVRRSTPEQLEQMRAARQWLKNQYFQRTHEHVKNQEYERALAELRRVFVIDRQDPFAHEFERKIRAMQELRKPHLPGAAEVHPPAPPATSIGAEPPPSEDTDQPSGTPAVPGDTPAASVPEPGTSPATGAGEEGERGAPSRRSNRLLYLMLGVALIAVVLALMYFWTREQPAGQPVLPPSGEVEEESSDDEPVYTIPPPVQIESTEADSKQADTMKVDNARVDTLRTP